VLHTFTGADGGGSSSVSPTILDAEGNLYGTTDVGGDITGCGCGVVFKLDPSGNETVLHTFTGPDGNSPFGGVVRDRATGNLYGPTALGGANGVGVVFKVDPAGNETVLHNFTGGADAYPSGPLILDKAGNLYGATPCCGLIYPGEVFKVNPDGNETVLYTFTGGVDGGGDGGGLVQDKAGNLYGTKTAGGNLGCALNPGGGCGVVFRLDPSGHETVLYNFCSQPNCADGAFPEYVRTLVLEEDDGESDAQQPAAGDGTLVEGDRERRNSAVRIYGTTFTGGSQNGACAAIGIGGCGVAFELTVPKEKD
jgi:uncharacterized repeat protein (TIGR03803 family)